MKPLSLLELSAQVRSMREELTAEAANPVGAAGGVAGAATVADAVPQLGGAALPSGVVEARVTPRGWRVGPVVEVFPRRAGRDKGGVGGDVGDTAGGGGVVRIAGGVGGADPIIKFRPRRQAGVAVTDRVSGRRRDLAPAGCSA